MRFCSEPHMKDEKLGESWISAKNVKKKKNVKCYYFLFASAKQILPLDKTRSCPGMKPADIT